MDYVEPILTIVSEIYTLIETVKANKKSCQRVFGRVKSLEQLVRSIQQRGTVQVSDDVEKALKELNSVLQMLSFSFGIVLWEIVTRKIPFQCEYLHTSRQNKAKVSLLHPAALCLDIFTFLLPLTDKDTVQSQGRVCSIEQIEQKVCKERSCEPFPDDCLDCPEALRKLIDDCREYDGFHRPSAGVLVDELQVLVAQLKKQ